MIIKLKDIATISSGVTFRTKIETSKDGDLRVIQMKDLGDDNLVHLNNTIHISYIAPKPNQLVQQGDIIFRSRGQTNTAALLLEDAEHTILAAPLFRVRADITRVLPEFLRWWINQASSQLYLSSRSEGTMIKMVSKQHLEDLEVMLPSLAQQRKIADFFSLVTREQQLLEEIKNKKAMYTQGILMQMVSESRSRVSNNTLGLDVATSNPGQPHENARR